VSTGSKLFRDHLQIKKSKNYLRIALQNLVFLKFLATNENGRCLVKDSSIVHNFMKIRMLLQKRFRPHFGRPTRLVASATGRPRM
jgi:hypothetical protein